MCLLKDAYTLLLLSNLISGNTLSRCEKIGNRINLLFYLGSYNSWICIDKISSKFTKGKTIYHITPLHLIIFCSPLVSALWCEWHGFIFLWLTKRRVPKVVCLENVLPT